MRSGPQCTGGLGDSYVQASNDINNSTQLPSIMTAQNPEGSATSRCGPGGVRGRYFRHVIRRAQAMCRRSALQFRAFHVGIVIVELCKTAQISP